VRIVLEGFRGEVRVNELCCQYGIAGPLKGRAWAEPTSPGVAYDALTYGIRANAQHLTTKSRAIIERLSGHERLTPP
jgi:hypothetical protein